MAGLVHSPVRPWHKNLTSLGTLPPHSMVEWLPHFKARFISVFDYLHLFSWQVAFCCNYSSKIFYILDNHFECSEHRSKIMRVLKESCTEPRRALMPFSLFSLHCDWHPFSRRWETTDAKLLDRSQYGAARVHWWKCFCGWDVQKCSRIPTFVRNTLW